VSDLSQSESESQVFHRTGWRYPTTLEYETVLDFVNDATGDSKSRHYALGEHLREESDYPDEVLEAKLKPAFYTTFR
jgi:hypothetical protein